LATAPDKPIGNEPIEQQAMLPTATVPVLILAEVGVYRDALARSLGRHRRCEVVGVAADLEEALAGVGQAGPAILLVDTRMPAGTSAVEALVVAAPDVRVVALAVAEDEREVIAFAEAGASGYVPLDGSIEDLVAVIESVSRGETLCSPLVAATLFRRVAVLARESWREPVEARLTARELDVLRLIEEGRSNKEIARALSIELSTVKNHVHNILEKLNVDSRTEAAARARRHDLRSLHGPGS
jgi:two-component system, NarL family, nitrate/nitrite response regulator NarL